jgi:hypothetical protein
MVEIFAQQPGNGAQTRLMARYILRDWAPIGPRPYRKLQVGLTSDVAPWSATGFSACSTKDKFSRFTGILPVHQRLIENGATSEFNRI